MHPNRRFSTLVLAVVLTLGASGCIGSNLTFERLRDWNVEATDSDWANEGIFLALNFVPPVYPLAYLVDLFVFNAIEFWSGTNPLE